MIGLLNRLFEAIGHALSFIINLLPDSPFMFEYEVGWLAVINWLIPIPVLVSQLTAYIVAVGTYYVVRVVLRWVKAVGS